MEIEEVKDHNEQIALRREKLKSIREKGIAFPNSFRRTHLAADLHKEYDSKTHEELEQEQAQVFIAGRIMMRRLMGKASFVHVQDGSGHIQLYLRQNDLGEDLYNDFKSWDIGDIIGAFGTVFKTKTGELSVKVQQIQLLTKSLRPLPDKWHGLVDHETRYRQRYVDLIVNQSSRKVFQTRIKIIQQIREFLDARNFMEVETPMMQTLAGGAIARPFVTHHNALGMDLYLRIAPELFLKRLVVGGFERVYEINRNFRNEGISTKHNPEFTMLEFYQAYADYKDLIALTEKLLRDIAKAVLGSMVVTYQGQEYDLAKPFIKMTLKESLLQFNSDLNDKVLSDTNELSLYMQSKGFPVGKTWGIGRLQFELFEHTVENRLMQPTFITEYPTEVSPLARCNDQNKEVTDRFEFFIAGKEMGNGFSELNDPEDQAARFAEQMAAKTSGDHEAMPYDTDYIHALEYGLPPTAGEGIGIDRLVMFFTDSPSIRDVVLFPHMRPC